MTGTAIATTPGRSLVVDLTKIDFAKVKTAFKATREKTGGGGGFTKMFPGNTILFSKQWKSGKTEYAGADSLILNMPHACMVWMKWEETDDGKKYPKFSKPAMLMLGQAPDDRDTLGDTDEDEWELYEGRPSDPWKLQFVVPCREVGSDVVNHISLSSVSARNAAADLFEEVVDLMSMHMGELPVVELGQKIASRDVADGVDKKGRPKTKKQSWDVPTFEIASWETADDKIDKPMIGAIEMSEASDDVGEVEERTKPAAEAKSSARPPAGNGKAITAPAPADKANSKVKVDVGSSAPVASKPRRKVSVN